VAIIGCSTLRKQIMNLIVIQNDSDYVGIKALFLVTMLENDEDLTQRIEFGEERHVLEV
jgi:hypothetical protein